jgi:hypothetical protein
VPTKLDDVVPALNQPGDETGTLFALAPQYATAQETSVTTASRMRLRHVDSGCWLHCPSLGGSSDRVSDETVELPLAVRKEAQVADVYRFEIVSSEYVCDLLFAKNCIDALSQFHAHCTQLIVTSVVALGPADFEHQEEREQCARLERVLSDAIKFVSVSTNEDPLTREGLPRPDQQSLMCELLAMESLMSIVELLLKPLISIREAKEAAGKGSAKRASLVSTDQMLTRRLRLCQRLMRLVLRRNVLTCKYVATKKDANGASAFVEPLGLQMGFGIFAAYPCCVTRSLDLQGRCE